MKLEGTCLPSLASPKSGHIDMTIVVEMTVTIDDVAFLGGRMPQR